MEKLEDYAIFSTFRCKFENITKGKVGNFFMIDCDDCVQIVAETTDGRIVLVEQYRFGSEEFSLELPGGSMHRGENAVDAAKRELEEETGFCGESAEVIAEIYPNPAIQTNVVHVVLIKNCRKTKDTNFDEFEDLATSLVTKQELLGLIRESKISHCIVIAAIAKYMLLEAKP